MAGKHGSPAKRSKQRAGRSGSVVSVFNVLANKIQLHARAAQAKQEAAELMARYKGPLTGEMKTAVMTSYWTALAALRSEEGSVGDWNALVCALNIAVVLTEKNIGDEYLADIHNALEAVFRIKQAQQVTGKWYLDGVAQAADLEAIDTAFEVHSGQADVATQAEMIWAISEVEKRVDAGIVYREAA
jgi:hypothetical protein